MTGVLQQPAGKKGCLQDPSPTWHVRGQCQSVAGLWPTDAVVAPDGRTVYITSAVDDRSQGGPFSSFVGVFERDTQTGLLREQRGDCVGVSDARHCSAARALLGPGSIAVSPDGRNVYVGSDGGIAVFRRTPAGGLAQLPGPSGCLLAPRTPSCLSRPLGTSGTAALAVSADGRNVYALVGQNPNASDNPYLLLTFRRNPESGALAQLPGANGCLAATNRPTCRLAAGLNGLAWEFSIALSPDGKNVYVGSGDGVASFSRLNDGHLVELPGNSACLNAADWKTVCTKRNDVQPYTGIVVSPAGRNVYFALEKSPNGAPAMLVTLARNAHTGALSFAGCANEAQHGCVDARALGDLTGIAISPDGRNLYTTGLHGAYPSSARILSFQTG